MSPEIAFVLARLSCSSPSPQERCVALSSPAGKRRFSVATNLEREVVLAPDIVDESDAKALALALHASVSQVDERWRFVRPEAMHRALVDADVFYVRSQARIASERVRGLARKYEKSPSKGVFEILKESRSQFESGKGGRVDVSSLEAMQVSPPSRLLASIVDTFSEKEWSLVSPGAITVFSNRPGPLEYQLPDVVTALKTYVSAQTQLAEWTQGAGSGQVDEKDGWLFPRNLPASGERTLIFQVKRLEGKPQFELRIYDRNGSLESDAILAAPSARTGTTMGENEPKLGFTKLTDPTIAAVENSVPESRSFRTELLSPDYCDPLDTYVRDSLTSYARAKGHSKAIACVPDDLYKGVWECLKGKSVDLDALSRKLIELGIEEIPSGKTLIFRPSAPLHEESIRIDRRPLQAEYQAATKGKLGIDALSALHAAYAASYETNSFLGVLQRRFQNAFRLAESPNWALPHAFLAVYGELSPFERSKLVLGTPFRLDLKTHYASLFALANYAESRSARPDADPASGITFLGSPDLTNPDKLGGLSLFPTRLLADPAGVWIEGKSDIQTRIKRVSRGFVTIRSVNSSTYETVVKSGENLVLDDQFLAFDHPSFFGALTARNSSDLESLSRQYRFLWSQDQRRLLTLTLGRGFRLGPVDLREPYASSPNPVSLEDVPGIVGLKRSH